MVKPKSSVERKMRDRVSTAGAYLQEGMAEAPDPIAILLKDPAGYGKKMVDGLAESIRRGNLEVGLKRAQKRDSWGKSHERAGRHFEERTDEMVTNALEDYDARASCIEATQKAVETMPTTTRAQRIAKSAAYQTKVAECFDRLYGRK